MEKVKLTMEEEKELFNIWRKGRENATKKKYQEMKIKAKKAN